MWPLVKVIRVEKYKFLVFKIKIFFHISTKLWKVFCCMSLAILDLSLHMHYAWHDTMEMTYVATGSAVVSSPRQSVERLFTLHTHCHFIVADPARGTLPQLCVLHSNKNTYTLTVWRDRKVSTVYKRACVHSSDVTRTDTSSTSFKAFLNDSFFCWKISMVAWKAWRKINNASHPTLPSNISNQIRKW